MISSAKTKNDSLVDVGYFLHNTRQNTIFEFSEVNGLAREDDYVDSFY